ncbi:hypothetical protein KUTeg_025067 [Tegillarca granosa]|uniref:Uncharacterized protein n=1 Tax=Tegillarca granosa TaxID=220873 RepID=A0ABQ9DZ69_TEGGR|nr:hypothetical protein KUTeg_025067 [Tegillarca granosa]
MGMSMKIERSTLDQVKKRFEINMKKKEEKKKDYDFEERMKELKEEIILNKSSIETTESLDLVLGNSNVVLSFSCMPLPCFEPDDSSLSFESLSPEISDSFSTVNQLRSSSTVFARKSLVTNFLCPFVLVTAVTVLTVHFLKK